jgi:hypothetical protein
VLFGGEVTISRGKFIGVCGFDGVILREISIAYFEVVVIDGVC